VPVNDIACFSPRSLTRCVTLIATTLVVGACATVRSVSALRNVDFALDRVTAIRLAGMPLDGIRSVDDLSPATVAVVAAAALAGTVPLECDVIVQATNPATNPVAADVRRMDWMLVLDGEDTVGGRVTRRRTIPPGETVEIPVHVAVDLAEVIGRHAGTLLRVGVALAGGHTGPVDLGLRVTPIVDTPFGGLPAPAFTIPLEAAGR
jgi:hypothetical protein